jgi:hypothetical protein
MQVYKTKNSFVDSEEAQIIRQKLQSMADSDVYNTEPTYTADTMHYPDSLIPFVDKHLKYLGSHPKLEAEMYLMNLRLMTRIR